MQPPTGGACCLRTHHTTQSAIPWCLCCLALLQRSAGPPLSAPFAPSLPSLRFMPRHQCCLALFFHPSSMPPKTFNTSPPAITPTPNSPSCPQTLLAASKLSSHTALIATLISPICHLGADLSRLSCSTPMGVSLRSTRRPFLLCSVVSVRLTAAGPSPFQPLPAHYKLPTPLSRMRHALQETATPLATRLAGFAWSLSALHALIAFCQGPPVNSSSLFPLHMWPRPAQVVR